LLSERAAARRGRGLRGAFPLRKGPLAGGPATCSASAAEGPQMARTGLLVIGGSVALFGAYVVLNGLATRLVGVYLGALS